MTVSQYSTDLEPNPANYTPLSPLTFLERAAAAAAMPDEKWGETPCAFVTLRADAGEIVERDIIDFCREQMAHFKAPRKVVFGPLPKTSTGKTQKFELRERARQL